MDQARGLTSGEGRSNPSGDVRRWRCIRLRDSCRHGLVGEFSVGGKTQSKLWLGWGGHDKAVLEEEPVEHGTYIRTLPSPQALRPT